MYTAELYGSDSVTLNEQQIIYTWHPS